METLCSSVSKLDELHEFFLQNNKLTDASGRKVTKALENIISKKSNNLSKVWMQGNGFSEEGRREMRAILSPVLSNPSNRVEL